MPYIIKGPTENYGPSPLPEDGLHPAVCVDVVDRGLHKQQFADQPEKVVKKLSIHFLIDQTIPAKQLHPHLNIEVSGSADYVGKPFMLSKWCTESLHERASLRKFLKQWRGRDFTEAELEGFDLEKLIGVPAAISVSHESSEKTGNWYARIESVSRMPKGWSTDEIDTAGYVRVKDRPTDVSAGETETKHPPVTLVEDNELPPLGDDDLPF